MVQLNTTTPDPTGRDKLGTSTVPSNYNKERIMSNTPNWQHNSKKDKKGKGVCKGRLRASKQSLRALKAKLNKS